MLEPSCEDAGSLQQAFLTSKPETSGAARRLSPASSRGSDNEEDAQDRKRPSKSSSRLSISTDDFAQSLARRLEKTHLVEPEDESSEHHVAGHAAPAGTPRTPSTPTSPTSQYNRPRRLSNSSSSSSLLRRRRGYKAWQASQACDGKRPPRSLFSLLLDDGDEESAENAPLPNGALGQWVPVQSPIAAHGDTELQDDEQSLFLDDDCQDLGVDPGEDEKCAVPAPRLPGRAGEPQRCLRQAAIQRPASAPCLRSMFPSGAGLKRQSRRVAGKTAVLVGKVSAGRLESWQAPEERRPRVPALLMLGGNGQGTVCANTQDRQSVDDASNTEVPLPSAGGQSSPSKVRTKLGRPTSAPAASRRHSHGVQGSIQGSSSAVHLRPRSAGAVSGSGDQGAVASQASPGSPTPEVSSLGGLRVGPQVFFPGEWVAEVREAARAQRRLPISPKKAAPANFRAGCGAGKTHKDVYTHKVADPAEHMSWSHLATSLTAGTVAPSNCPLELSVQSLALTQKSNFRGKSWAASKRRAPSLGDAGGLRN